MLQKFCWSGLTLLSLVLLTPAARAGVEECEQKLSIEKPFLYRVSRGGQVSYLLGTMHVGVPLKAFSREVLSIFQSSTDLTVEVDLPLFRMLAGHVGRKLFGLNPFRRTLAHDLTPAQLGVLRERMTLNGKSPGKAERLDITSAIMAAGKNSRHYDLAIKSGRMDAELRGAFANGEAKIHHLETFAEAMVDLKDLMSLRILRKRLDMPYSELTDPADLQKAYVTGDPDETVRLAREAHAQEPELMDRMMRSRNLKWLPKIAAILRTPGQHLIAVGSGHLFDHDGLIPLLEAVGYTVTRVPAGER